MKKLMYNIPQGKLTSIRKTTGQIGISKKDQHPKVEIPNLSMLVTFSAVPTIIKSKGVNLLLTYNEVYSGRRAK
jgi:hypothetical protein